MEFILKDFNELGIDELYDIMRVRNEVFVVEQNCIYQDLDNKDKSAYHLFYRENGEIVAYLRILDKGISYDEVSIGRVLVIKDQRKNGLASKLLQKAIEFIENTMRQSDIRISAQLYLEEFYKSLGFVVTSDMYYEDDIPHIEMLYSNSK